MRVQNAIGMRTMFLGLAATLLLATSARSQQEMDPTYFDVNPGASQQQQADASLAAQYNAAHQMQEPEMAGLSAASDLPATADATLEADLGQVTLADSVTMMIFFGGVVLIVGYALAGANRARRSHIVGPRNHASGATAL